MVVYLSRVRSRTSGERPTVLLYLTTYCTVCTTIDYKMIIIGSTTSYSNIILVENGANYCIGNRRGQAIAILIVILIFPEIVSRS